MEETATPLFRQVAQLLEDSIMEGDLQPGGRAPSTNELAEFHKINPATARKGLNLLVAAGILEKRRGVGMFITTRAPELIAKRRQAEFPGEFLAPLIDEAMRLHITRRELHHLLDRVGESRGLYA